MTPEQLDEWIAADQLEQIIGLEKLYAQLALIGAALVNSWGGKAELQDFIPQFERKQDSTTAPSESEISSPSQMAAMFKMHAANEGWNFR